MSLGLVSPPPGLGIPGRWWWWWACGDRWREGVLRAQTLPGVAGRCNECPATAGVISIGGRGPGPRLGEEPQEP